MPLPGVLLPRADRRLRDAILSLQPTAYWPLDDGSGQLSEVAGCSGSVALATSADADDIVDTVTSHGMAAGDRFTFTALTGGSSVTTNTPYWVLASSLAAATFQFSLTEGGAAVSFGSDITAGTIRTPHKRRPAAVTGSPLFGVSAPVPVGRGITWSGTGQYGTTTGSTPNAAGTMSVMAVFRTTDTNAAVRTLVARVGGVQCSFGLHLTASHTVSFEPTQSDGTAHATATPGGAMNDGAWHLVTGTFDGTTVVCRVDRASASSTSLTGSWFTASTTVGIGLAHRNTSLLWAGSMAHAAYWSNRALTGAEHDFLYRTAMGG